jgi:hypothetical protein
MLQGATIMEIVTGRERLRTRVARFNIHILKVSEKAHSPRRARARMWFSSGT